MKHLIFIVATLFALTSFASLRVFDSTTDLKLNSGIKCGNGLACSRVGKGIVQVDVDGAGQLNARVAATATTITAAQCGSTFYNSGAVVINLPEASAVLGCRLTFVTMNAANFDVNPDDADQILVLTDAAGDAIRNATLGNSVVLEAMSASQWVAIALPNGTYTDVN